MNDYNSGAGVERAVWRTDAAAEGLASGQVHQNGARGAQVHSARIAACVLNECTHVSALHRGSENVITYLSFDDEKIVSGSDDHTLKVWLCGG